MRSTIGWSYRLLGEAERRLLNRLAVFAGGFRLEAAESVTRGAGKGRSEGEIDAEDVVGALEGLVEQSLVAVGPRAAGDEPRYAMLEPIRQYALGRLRESGEAEDALRRHALYCEALAVRAGPELRRAGQAEWLDRLASEQDNLRAAMGWLLEQGEAGRVIGMGAAMHRFWSLRGHTGEGRRWMGRALTQGAVLQPGDRARALFVDGILSFTQGEADQAAAAAGESIAEARAGGDGEILAAALLLRGVAAVSLAEVDVAAQILPEALELFRERGDRSGVALVTNGLAMLAIVRADLDRADTLSAEAGTLVRAQGDWFSLAGNQITQALVARLRGDEERAGTLLRESVRLAHSLRDAWTVVTCITGLAGVAGVRNQAERAARLLGVAEALREKMGVSVSWGPLRASYETDLADARERLGAEVFDVVVAEGRAMSMEQAVEYALSATEPAGSG